MDVHLWILLAAVAVAALASPARSLEVRSPDGDLYAFPSLLDDHGRPLAESTLVQSARGGHLDISITHSFHDGRRAVERARFTEGKELVQESWSWEERRGERVERAFQLDFLARRARVRVMRKDGHLDHWDQGIDVEPGRTFAGVGIAYALKNVRDRLVAGEEVTLRTVAFLPKPFSVRLHAKYVRREKIQLAGRDVDADKLEVRPDLKGLEKIVELFKDPAGADVWIHHGRPPMILRVRYPMVAVSDPTVVIETLGTPRSASDGERSRRARRGGR